MCSVSCGREESRVWDSMYRELQLFEICVPSEVRTNHVPGDDSARIRAPSGKDY